MLEEMLRIVASRGTAHMRELAAELDITPDLARQMLEQLVRQGYLKTVTPTGGTLCRHCPLRPACLFRHQPGIWVLTEKGERLLALRGHGSARMGHQADY